MSIDDAIIRFKSYHPITEEDKEAFECAIQCMVFTRDFLPLGAMPERMKHALNLLNSFEYAIKNTGSVGGHIYFVTDENKLKTHKANADRIAEAVERTKKYTKRD